MSVGAGVSLGTVVGVGAGVSVLVALTLGSSVAVGHHSGVAEGHSLGVDVTVDVWVLVGGSNVLVAVGVTVAVAVTVAVGVIVVVAVISGGCVAPAQHELLANIHTSQVSGNPVQSVPMQSVPYTATQPRTRPAQRKPNSVRIGNGVAVASSAVGLGVSGPSVAGIEIVGVCAAWGGQPGKGVGGGVSSNVR